MQVSIPKVTARRNQCASHLTIWTRRARLEEAQISIRNLRHLNQSTFPRLTRMRVSFPENSTSALQARESRFWRADNALSLRGRFSPRLSSRHRFVTDPLYQRIFTRLVSREEGRGSDKETRRVPKSGVTSDQFQQCRAFKWSLSLT